MGSVCVCVCAWHSLCFIFFFSLAAISFYFWSTLLNFKAAVAAQKWKAPEKEQAGWAINKFEIPAAAPLHCPPPPPHLAPLEVANLFENKFWITNRHWHCCAGGMKGPRGEGGWRHPARMCSKDSDRDWHKFSHEFCIWMWVTSCSLYVHTVCVFL